MNDGERTAFLPRAATEHDEEDLALLRRFEPVLRFTQGEMFFPTAADGYIRRSSLWVRPPHHESMLLVDVGDLDPDSLASAGALPTGNATYMRFVERPLSGREYQRWALRHWRPAD
jgi:hypothetical protein